MIGDRMGQRLASWSSRTCNEAGAPKGLPQRTQRAQREIKPRRHRGTKERSHNHGGMILPKWFCLVVACEKSLAKARLFRELSGSERTDVYWHLYRDCDAVCRRQTG